MKIKISILSLIFLFALYSCSGDINPLSNEVKESQAVAELKAAIAHSPFFNDEGQGDSGNTSASSTPYSGSLINFGFQGWYRTFVWETLTRTISIKQLDIVNGTATVEVTGTVSGILNVGENWFGVLLGLNTVTKAFTHYHKRCATFSYIDGYWQVQTITPSYSASYPLDTTPEIDFEYIRVYNSSTSALMINVEDTTTYYSRDTLPRLSSSVPIKVVAKVKNNISDNTNYCYLHHHLIIRNAMYDDGNTTYGDTTAGDKIYSRTYNPADTPGIYYAFFDILSKDTLNKNVANTYKSVVWGIPYIVE